MPFYKINKLLPFFLLWFCLASSQNYPANHYTAANKLPNNAVRSLFVDSNNILWIGTQNGLVKRENDVFESFFEEDGLALNSCWAIAEDNNRQLWFGSYGEGISIYDGYNFKIISEEDGLVHNEITKLFSRGNYMYVGTSDGISVIDINTYKVSSFSIPATNELFRIRNFFEYQNQVYVVSYRSGIYKLQNRDNKFDLVKVNDQKFIYSVLIDNDSIYSSNKGFFTKSLIVDYVSEKDTGSIKKYGYSIIWDYVKTRKKKIFAGAWGIYDTSGGIYEVVDNFLVSRASEFNVFSKEVISLAYDPKFEKLYIGTRDAGLFEIALNPEIKFQQIGEKEILGFAGTNNTSAVLLSDGVYLMGTESEQKISLNQFKYWQKNYLSYKKLPLPKHQDDFYELDFATKAGEIIFYDLKVSGNLFWINTSIGIFVINDSGELDRYLPLHTEEINFTEEGNLIETNPYGGVRLYSDLDAFSYTHYQQADPTTPTMVVNSLQKGDKTYFLSIFSGLFVWENKTFKSYLKEGIWQEKKLSHITGLGDDLAISNEFGDIFIVNDEKSFTVLEEIPRAKINGNSISFLSEYRGTLLIGTEKGLTLYNNKRFIFLDKEQGLEQPLLSATVSQDSLYIGSREGYYIIDLNALIKPEPLVEQIKLKEIYVNNKEYPVKQLTGEDKVKLEHDENSILLKFSTNAHPYPNKLKYQYRLNDNETWSLASSEPEVFLPSLPPNRYNIEIKVLDESTGLNYTRPLLNLAILPPFWKTWWFVLLVIGILAMAVYSIYKAQILQAKKFEKQKGLIQKRFEETKMEALLSQMNPHFIFNAMNSIQYYIMDSDIDRATNFLGDFSKLIRLNLDHCTKPTILLVEEIEYLQSYIRVENTRFNNKIKVEFKVDPSIDTYEVEIPTMLLQTFVENVFVHAFPGSVTNPILNISFKLLSKDVLECKIEDNGVGISNASGNKLHQSKGVSLVKERLALLGYDVAQSVQITSEENKGTCVTLILQV